MDALEQCQRYVQAMGPAVSGQGGHAHTYRVACVIVHGYALSRQHAAALLSDWNQTCLPPWSEKELEHKLDEAEKANHDKPRGHLLRPDTGKSVTFRYGESFREPEIKHHPSNNGANRAQPEPKAVVYTPSSEAKLPDPIQDGCRELIRTAFQPGEGIRICQAVFNSDKKEIPKNGGLVFTREEWLKQLDEVGGDINQRLSSPERNGIFITINPMRLGGSKDSDVTAFRHALIEWDGISKVEQWEIIRQSGVPVTAVIDSGGKSIHAWVKVDAKDRNEYRDRVVFLHQHFESSGFRVDPANKNASRFSRLASCVRGQSRQELLALNIGSESWVAWRSKLETENIGRRFFIRQLRQFDSANDPNCLIGDRWICRGGSCNIVGQSGIGKSSIMLQMAIQWNLARSFCGITPKKRLRSLIIQAENDEGDLAEVTQGVLDGLSILPGSDDEKKLDDGVIIIRDSSHAGESFCRMAERLIEVHHPDLFWVDPLNSFFGDNISEMRACSKFLTEWLGPISEASGVAWMFMHHTGKPPSDKEAARKGQTVDDLSYMGIGSSVLTNWARAICYLHRVTKDGTYAFDLAKRGKRANAMDFDGAHTTTIYLRHAATGIRWDQCEKPADEDLEQKKRGRPKKQAAHNSDAHNSQPLSDDPFADPQENPVSENQTMRRDEKHKPPGKPTKLDMIRPFAANFCAAWGKDEILSRADAAQKLVDWAFDFVDPATGKKLKIELSKRTADDAIDQLCVEGFFEKSKKPKCSTIFISLEEPKPEALPVPTT